MSSGTHYLRPDSVRDICREPRMARGHAFVGSFCTYRMTVLRQARLGSCWSYCVYIVQRIRG